MLISLLNSLLISNALTLRKDKSILFSRIVMVSLILTNFLVLNIGIFGGLSHVNVLTQIINICIFGGLSHVNVLTQIINICIFGGLFHVTVFTQIFNIFIFLISAVILTLTSFYPRKVFFNQISSLYFLLFNQASVKLNYIKIIFHYSEKENYNKVNFKPENIILSSSLSITITVLTLILILLLFIPNELFKLANIFFFIFKKWKSQF